jgi:hypothetical protein
MPGPFVLSWSPARTRGRSARAASAIGGSAASLNRPIAFDGGYHSSGLGARNVRLGQKHHFDQRRSLPILPGKRKYLESAGMSQTCQRTKPLGRAMWSVSFDRSCSLGAAVRKSAGADELWGGKLRGAVLSRAAHIVFLRIQVKHAQGSDLMRDPLDGNRPGPPPPAVQLRAPPFRPQWRCATANLSPPGGAER